MSRYQYHSESNILTSYSEESISINQWSLRASNSSLMLNPTSEVLVDGDTEVDHIELISSTCNRGVARSKIVVVECSKVDRGHFKFKFILGKYSYTILLLLQLLLLYTYIPLYPKC